MAYQLDPVKFIQASRTKEFYDNKGVQSPAFSGIAAQTKKKEDIGGFKSLGSVTDFGNKEGKKALYKSGFTQIADDVGMLAKMEAADTGLAVAEEQRKAYERMQAKQRAACQKSKKRGLIGSLVGVGIGVATGNPAVAISSGLGGLNSLTASC
jgi:hypothetical protein